VSLAAAAWPQACPAQQPLPSFPAQQVCPFAIFSMHVHLPSAHDASLQFLQLSLPAQQDFDVFLPWCAAGSQQAQA